MRTPQLRPWRRRRDASACSGMIRKSLLGLLLLAMTLPSSAAAYEWRTTIFYEPCLGLHGRPGPPRANVLERTCGGWATADN
jgi:hypothetical protein